MPAFESEKSTQGSESPRQLRWMLQKTLLTDSDFEAFCIDYFPEIQRQFSAGMERTRKENLLLACVPQASLFEHLSSYAAGVVKRRLAKPGAGPGAVPPRSSILRRLGWVSLWAVCVLGTVFGGRARLQPKPYVPGMARSPTQTSSASPVARPASVPWLTSDPSGALVVEAATGHLLGQTPWSPAQVAPSVLSAAAQLRVCLRRAGFVPVLVSLELGEGGPDPKHVPLQREPLTAGQRHLGQEECNAPTPIIP